MARVVKAGDDIRKGITASWFNEQNKRRTQAKSNGLVHIPENPVKVDCVANTGLTFSRFQAANIVGPAIPYEDFDGDAVQYSTSRVKVNSTLVADKWGILQGPCTQDNPSKLVVSGVTWALFNYTSGHTHVDVVSGALTSGTSGKAIILSPPESPGLPGLILIRGGVEVDHFLFTLLEDMDGADAAAEIRSMDDTTQIKASADVKNTLGDFGHLVTGNRGICVKVDDVYYAVHPEEVLSNGVVFTLTANLAGTVSATATATVTVSGDPNTPVSSTITVYNTGTKTAYTGAVGWAVKINGVWWLAEINQYALLSVATLSINTHVISAPDGKIANQQTVTISALVAISSYPESFIPGTLPTLANPRNLIGLSGDKATVAYNRTNNTWEMLELRPANSRLAKIKLTASWPYGIDATATSFTVISNESEVGGEIPTISTVKDINSLAMNAKTDDTGIVRFNYVTAAWELVSITHTATIFRGTITTGFTGGDTSTTFDVTPEFPYNGLIPSGDQTVKNTFGMLQGNAAQKVIVIWNPMIPQWEILEILNEFNGDIEFLVTAVTTVSDTDSPYDGMRKFTVDIIAPPCNRKDLHLTEATVYEHDPQCLASDETDAALVGRKGTAGEGVFQDQSSGASPGDLTPCHWYLKGICCP